MVTEQNKTLQALQIAIRMEVDGKKYYNRMSRGSSNQLGRKLFQTLASEEDVHRQKFEEIYDALQQKKAWPRVDFRPDLSRKLKTVFARGIEEMGSKLKTPATEFEVIQTAMDMENRTHEFYKNQSKNAAYDAEREYYETLAAEERGHYLVLVDYREYLNDPAGWFVNQEHPSLNGG